MEYQSTYKLHDAVRFLQHSDYAIVTHLENGAWFKIVPWAVEVLSKLGAESLDKCVRHVAKTYGQPDDIVRQFFETLDQSDMLTLAAADKPAKESQAGPRLESVVWRTNAGESLDTLFNGQAAVRFIDTLVMSRVQRVALEGDWLTRGDISDILSLIQMLLGFVSLTVDDTSVSSESCASLESVPELVEVQATDLCSRKGDPLAATRQAVSTLKDNHFDMLRVRMQLRDLYSIGLAGIFEALDSLEVGLNLTSFLPSERNALCLAGQLGESLVGAEDVISLFKAYLAHEVSKFNIFSLQWFFDQLLKRTRCTCGAGQCFVVVESDGSIYPCLSLITDEMKIGQWSEGKILNEIIAASPIMKTLQQRNVDDIPGCRDCDARYFCGGGCPANAMRAGNLLAQDPFCAVYQKLYRTAIAAWRDDVVLEKNFAAMVDAL